MSDLADKRCVPCQGGVPPLTAQEIAPLLAKLEGWLVEDDHHLEKTYKFRDFERALGFVNRVGALADHENHHPDLHLSWGRVDVAIWTHKIDGLTESDFVFAAKCDREYHPEPQPMRQVWRAPEPATAFLMAGHLESQGVRATVRGESLFAGEGSLIPAEATPTVWVPETDANRAMAIIEEHQARLFAADEDADAE